MRQISKKGNSNHQATNKRNKKVGGTVKKKGKNGQNVDKRLPVYAKTTKEKRKHPKFGTSKLEKDFAKNFLDKLGIKYVWQFEAKEIKRFFDYYIPDSRLLIEVDGDYYHSYGLVREEMSPMQKKNKRVDSEKDTWAALHGIPLVRIWEHDIRNNPKKVLEFLDEKIQIGRKKVLNSEEWKKRHKNGLNDLNKEKKKE